MADVVLMWGMHKSAGHTCILVFGLAPCQRELANIWARAACTGSCFLPEHLSLESIPSDPGMCRHKLLVDKGILKPFFPLLTLAAAWGCIERLSNWETLLAGHYPATFLSIPSERTRWQNSFCERLMQPHSSNPISSQQLDSAVSWQPCPVLAGLQ